MNEYAVFTPRISTSARGKELLKTERTIGRIDEEEREGKEV
jgi:hypothetical protein